MVLAPSVKVLETFRATSPPVLEEERIE